MKKHNKHKNIRFKETRQSQSSKPQVGTMKPEDLIVYIRRAKKEVLPMIEKMKASPTSAQFLLAQQTHIFVTDAKEPSIEDVVNSASIILLLWKDGLYVPGPEYPFTLEETLREIEEGINAKENYSEYFQVFTPLKNEQPQGIGQVSGGIVKHPETNLWQIWMIVDGPCGYVGGYLNPEEAQKNLEEIIQATRMGRVQSRSLNQRLQSHARVSIAVGQWLRTRFGVPAC